jgi:hypothetical protein
MGQTLHVGADEPIILRMLRPGVREKAALRDIYAHLQPVLPLLHFLGDIAVRRPELADKTFELAQTGIAIPLADVVRLMVVLEKVERELLPKE